jgi:hypothetical protein
MSGWATSILNISRPLVPLLRRTKDAFLRQELASVARSTQGTFNMSACIVISFYRVRRLWIRQGPALEECGGWRERSEVSSLSWSRHDLLYVIRSYVSAIDLLLH